jgi:branched-chain amino acid transport system substrate-binding protein
MLFGGFISPRTGPLGIFGKTDGHILDLVRTSLKDGFGSKLLAA